MKGNWKKLGKSSKFAEMKGKMAKSGPPAPSGGLAAYIAAKKGQK